MRSALRDAQRDGLVQHNAAADARVLPATRAKVRPWEPAELGAFLDQTAGVRLGPLYQVMAHTGPRRGEACGLRWEDVGLARSRLVIRQQLLQRDGQEMQCTLCGGEHRGVDIGPPKAASGEARRVDLSAQVVGILLEQRLPQDAERVAWGDAYANHGLVFARENGNPLSTEQVSKTFSRLVKRAGLRPIRLHDLRHGRASLLLAAGADMSIVSKLLGHSSNSFTADTYVHLLEGMGIQAAEAADALIPRKPRDHSVTTSLPEQPSPDTQDDETPGRLSGPRGTRTHNPRIKSPLLCQLS